MAFVLVQTFHCLKITVSQLLEIIHRCHLFIFLFVYISDWIYENMASVSVHMSYAKCVLGTKTLTLPTQDNGWLSAPPTELCNYHDNHSKQRPDSAGEGKLRTKVRTSQSLYWTLLLTEGVVSKQPPPYPTSFDPQAWSTLPLLGQSLAIQLYQARRQAPYFFEHWTGLEPGCAWGQAPGKNLVATF